MITVYEKIDEIIETIPPRLFVDYMFHNYKEYLNDVAYHAQMERLISDLEREITE